MRKRDTLFFASATFLAILLGLSTIAIPTAPGLYQRAVNDRIIKIKLLEARSLPGSFSVDLPIKVNTVHKVQWKDLDGALNRATFILTDNGELTAGHGFSGDFVPVVNWYEVGE